MLAPVVSLFTMIAATMEGFGVRYAENSIKKKGVHIDVENPGNRLYQIHLQKDEIKYYYNSAEKALGIEAPTRELAPCAIQQLLKKPNAIKAIGK